MGAAFVGIFVPFLHFIITPGFVLVAAIAFALTIRQDKIVPLISGPCPACGQMVEFTNRKFASIQKDACPSCRHVLKIELSP